jgi:hypothetical protein
MAEKTKKIVKKEAIEKIEKETRRVTEWEKWSEGRSESGKETTKE